MSAALAEGQAPPADYRHLVLYDGVCGFCDWSVQWLLEHDTGAVLHFAPLQGETAAALRQRHPEIPADIDTIVLVQRAGQGERVSLRSSAVFETLRLLPGRWRWLAWLRLLPRFLTDLGYRLFSAIRYRTFGKLDSCRLPDPAERARFLP